MREVLSISKRQPRIFNMYINTSRARKEIKKVQEVQKFDLIKKRFLILSSYPSVYCLHTIPDTVNTSGMARRLYHSPTRLIPKVAFV